MADGITYTLQALTDLNSTTADFNLHITGINVTGVGGDTEGGRKSVGSFAFGDPLPVNLASGVGPAGYNFLPGGLNSGGCDGSGAFFCFQNPALYITPGPVLAAGAVLDLAFSLTLSSGNFLAWNAPHLKIDWLGEKNNYDLVSLSVGPIVGVSTQCTNCAAPGPVVGAGIPALLTACFGMFGLNRWRRRRQTGPISV